MMRLEMFKRSVPMVLSMVAIGMLTFSQHALAQGAAAGKVVFVMGTPQAINAAGTARNLARGDEIFSGDRLVTGRGRLQLNMADGAFISVQPNSEYVLDNYRYSGQPDGTEQAVYRLAKGGVRAVTGLIGRTNKEAYKVNTAVATIGIRGTGHNTRLCAGDCAGGTKDGLYHNTWEGITYVVNDVDSEDVPAGQGVYVEDIDTPILPLDQAPGVTAAVTDTEELREEEEETREAQDDATIVAAGEQRNPEGDQTAVVGDGVLTPTASEAVSGLGLLGIHSETDNEDGDDVFGMTDASVLVDPDGKVIGIIGLDDEGELFPRGFGTINLNAALGVDDPALQTEIKDFVGLLDPEDLRLFLEDPAEAVETTFLSDNAGFGRWANGRFLATDDDGSTQLFIMEELTGFQSLHFIFGPLTETVPVLGNADYEFVGGTQSTSRSGASIGSGVTYGGIFVNFGIGSAQLIMDVDHNGNLYAVGGQLSVIAADNSLEDAGVYASTSLAGSACNPMCPTFIEGGFVGDLVSGVPEFLGLEYEIQETDPILGVAAFGAAGGLLTSLVVKPMVLVAVQPEPLDPDQIGVTLGSDAALHFDIGTGELIGAIITQWDEDPMNPTGPEIQTRAIGTVNLQAMLQSDDPGAITELNSLLSSSGNSTLIADFEASPASVVEFSSIGPVGFGRWANGKFLSVNSSHGTEVLTLTGNQSLHVMYGPDPGVLPTTGFATYNFIGGTQSTSISGATIGNGVTGGDITVDFGASSANLNMTVDHLSLFTVSGPLNVNTVENGIYDSGSVFATTDISGPCYPSSCTVFIDGGFAGPDSTSVPGTPAYIGVEYDIQVTDVITGVAGFAN